MDYLYAVIIPHYNDVTRLERCLDVLARHKRDDTEIVVVDNMSTAPLADTIAKFPSIRFLFEPGKGAALARNTGVRETTAPTLFFIDADCLPAEDWLETATRVYSQADLVGGRVDVFDETPPPRSGAEAFEAVFAFPIQSYIRDQGFTVTANLLTRREVFEDVGFFRNGLSEDLDWCQRAKAKGYNLVYVDDLAVCHPSRQNEAALKHKWRRVTQELYALNGTSIPARMRWAARALAMPLSAVAHTPKVLRNSQLNGAGERWRGLVTLYRLRSLRGLWMLGQAAGSVFKPRD
ncbi:glycosyltransferase [Roseobacter sp. N2S]|uniref:glycosyltransferase family 2 protein n=1 Tax=Roseobacter sp. N2S TaxID=2663844 RepID=UPI002862AD29|nr:glycosyltransferase [Roseobacter sp. N2S]MDR6267660.1 GT2 family glycosyltransferase [Roseobacter sp. N2S]